MSWFSLLSSTLWNGSDTRVDDIDVKPTSHRHKAVKPMMLRIGEDEETPLQRMDRLARAKAEAKKSQKGVSAVPAPSNNSNRNTRHFANDDEDDTDVSADTSDSLSDASREEEEGDDEEKVQSDDETEDEETMNGAGKDAKTNDEDSTDEKDDEEQEEEDDDDGNTPKEDGGGASSDDTVVHVEDFELDKLRGSWTLVYCLTSAMQNAIHISYARHIDTVETGTATARGTYAEHENIESDDSPITLTMGEFVRHSETADSRPRVFLSRETDRNNQVTVQREEHIITTTLRSVEQVPRAILEDSNVNSLVILGSHSIKLPAQVTDPVRVIVHCSRTCLPGEAIWKAHFRDAVPDLGKFLSKAASVGWYSEADDWFIVIEDGYFYSTGCAGLAIEDTSALPILLVPPRAPSNASAPPGPVEDKTPAPQDVSTAPGPVTDDGTSSTKGKAENEDAKPDATTPAVAQPDPVEVLALPRPTVIPARETFVSRKLTSEERDHYFSRIRTPVAPNITGSYGLGNQVPFIPDVDTESESESDSEAELEEKDKEQHRSSSNHDRVTQNKRSVPQYHDTRSDKRSVNPGSRFTVNEQSESDEDDEEAEDSEEYTDDEEDDESESDDDLNGRKLSPGNRNSGQSLSNGPSMRGSTSTLRSGMAIYRVSRTMDKTYKQMNKQGAWDGRPQATMPITTNRVNNNRTSSAPTHFGTSSRMVAMRGAADY